MTTIQQTYLMWVGTDHYPTIQDYVTEAKTQGVSKRLPNKVVAQALQKPGTVIFLAHDEGQHDECVECLAVERCKPCKGAGKFSVVPGAPPEQCKACDGDGKLLKGTGGKVIVDGEEWPYRTWLYYVRQPEKFNPEDHDIEGKFMCEGCGGSGHTPKGKVFGMFLPQRVEYILKETDAPTVRKEMEARGIIVKTVKEVKVEKERGCGKRQPGGFYAVTTEEKDEKRAAALVNELVDTGKLDPANVSAHGSFVEFLVPVDIPERRFRGIKRWTAPSSAGAVTVEAQMIVDALEEPAMEPTAPAPLGMM